jgi:prepilin peptidase CpaA
MFDPLSNHLLIGIMLTILGIAVLSDLQDRRIPNQLVVFGLLLGLTGQTLLAEGGGLTTAGSGALVGLACLLPFYISGGLGAGDVKLMAMCGAFLGPQYAVVASVASLLVGGVIGVAWFFWQFFARGDHYITDDYITDDGTSASIPAVGHQTVPTSAIPYAVAIFVGNLIALKAKPMILPVFNGGISS